MVAVRADRLKLAKRRWRAQADDGVEFGIDVETPLQDGDAIWATETARYVLRQEPEPVLEIPLDLAPDAAAVIGWSLGNLHLPVEAQPNRLLAPDEPGLRQTLDRLAIHYHPSTEVFRPGRFTGTLAGHGHAHGPHSEADHTHEH